MSDRDGYEVTPLRQHEIDQILDAVRAAQSDSERFWAESGPQSLLEALAPAPGGSGIDPAVVVQLIPTRELDFTVLADEIERLDASSVRAVLDSLPEPDCGA